MLTISQLLIKEELSNTPNCRHIFVYSALCDGDEPPGPLWPYLSLAHSFPGTHSPLSSCPSLPVSVPFCCLCPKWLVCVHALGPMFCIKPLLLHEDPSSSLGCLLFMPQLPGVDFHHNIPCAIVPSFVHLPMLGCELPVFRDWVLFFLDFLCLTQSVTWNNPSSII